MTTAPRFAVNGRFLAANATGVQRYALNVVRAMEAALAARGESGLLLAPAAAADPGLAHLPLRRLGPLSGHAWEQLTLPARWSGPLVNLGNTAPLARPEQIVCIHDANVFIAPDSYSRAFRALYGALQPAIARRAARVATVSHAAARQIANHLPLRLADIAVLPNGHEHALGWNPAAASTTVMTLIDAFAAAERPFVLVLGSRARHKNLRLVTDLAPALDELGIDIVVAGGGAGIFAGENMQDRPNVHLLGRVSDDDLACLFDRALCLMFPSLTEGFGLPIVEAMARGCPVIASDCASMPEVCGPAALLAAPDAAAAWVAHVRALAASPMLAGDLAGAGRQWVGRFSWADTAAGYLALAADPAAAIATTPPFTARPPAMTVAVATRGRPAVVAATVRHLIATQTLQPRAVIVSCVDRLDAGDLVDCPDVTIVTGPPGLAAQRNTALANLPEGTEVVVFFDDDFVADANWLAAAAEVFRDDVGVVGLTGHVIADGIKGPGIAFEDALALIAAAPPPPRRWVEPFSPYGCNMAFRVSAIGDSRFDERLVLYGWLEDRDFAAALVRRQGGRCVKSTGPAGVHLGTKGGRVTGDRLGYSQIVNPLYMLRKGTMTLSEAAGQIFRNVASNFGLLLRPEPFIDRRGRVRGNLLGFADVLRGELKPERAAALASTGAASSHQPEGKIR